MKKVAIYARYSTDLQNPRSIDDQIRVCRERAEREGWSVYQCYGDYAISGASMERSGLQRLLADANAGRFNIILAEALDRLSRDQADIATIFKRMQFASVEIITISEGQVGIVDVGLRGTMNQLFLIETGNKVRRGQRGRIKEGRVAGGLAYGYDLVRRVDTKGELIRGERKINENQAQVIRRIFHYYAGGRSPRAIAHRLNKEEVPAPAGRAWTASAIVGNSRRCTGILNNESYIGNLLWNRRTNAKHPETRKPVTRLNPESEWIRGQCSSLRIVKQKLWDRVKERQRRMSCRTAVAALDAKKGTFRERRSKFLLSGLLHCGCCGGGYVMRDDDRLCCSSFLKSGTCANHLRIARKVLEDKVLTALKQRLAGDPEQLATFCEAYARQLREMRLERDELAQAYRAELARVEAEYERLTDTPKCGTLKSNPSAELKSVIDQHGTLTRELSRVLAPVELLELTTARM
jgi:DNA invertase Pin-like site-specific DNA recombinase